MTQSKLTRTALALALVSALASLAACGGGGADTTAAISAEAQFSTALASQQAEPSNRLHALAADGRKVALASTVITNAQLFQGAEAIFPDLFPTQVAPTPINNLPYDGKLFQVRAYANGNFLGVASDGKVYGLGPYTGNVLVDLGAMQGYADLVCSRINCGPTGGGNNGPVGPLNGCTEPASVGLVPGRTMRATYISTVLSGQPSTGEYVIESVVNGPATFEGQSATKISTTLRGMQFGIVADSTAQTYHRAAEHDLTLTLGTESQAVIAGMQSSTKVVFVAPAKLNNEYSLALGAALTKTESMTSSTVMIGLPIEIPPTTTTSTTTYTYEARESVTVAAGTFQTCRYKLTTQGSAGSMTIWSIVGRGLSAKTENRDAGGVVDQRSELKSATINGGAI